MTHVLAGPFSTYQMALLGANVVKIESPIDPDCARGRGPDDEANRQGLGLNYQVQGGNKRALALNLAVPQGRATLLQLVGHADVLVENYSTGALDRLGLGYGRLREANPELIHCSITGYGDTGPKARLGAYDNVIQAVSGIIAQSKGYKPGVSFVDYAAGYSAAFAVAAALVQRARTRTGCHISVSMLEVAMQMMAPEAAAAQHPARTGRGKEAGISDYETSDGRIMLGAFRPGQYRRLGQLLGELDCPVPELFQIGNWPDVWRLSSTLRQQLEEVFVRKPTAEWVALLRKADLPIEPILDLGEALDSPQLAARDYFRPNPADENVTLPLTAFRMSEGGPDLLSPPPVHGEHSREILHEFGIPEDEVARLFRDGVVK